MNPLFKAPSMLSNPNQTHPPCCTTNRCMPGVTIKCGLNIEHIFVFSASVIYFFLLLIPQELFPAFYILDPCWCLLHWQDVHGLFFCRVLASFSYYTEEGGCTHMLQMSVYRKEFIVDLDSRTVWCCFAIYWHALLCVGCYYIFYIKYSITLFIL